MSNRISPTGIAIHDGWQPVTHRDPSPTPVYKDQRDRPLDLILTPKERSKAAVAYCALMDSVRQANRNDTAQAAADALARLDRELELEPMKNRDGVIDLAPIRGGAL